jgi:hypothetical protein
MGMLEDVIGPPVLPFGTGCRRKTLRKAPDGVRDQLETSLQTGCDN